MPDEQVPITEEWLKFIRFRWAEWERSGGKHWDHLVWAMPR
jgi:hypothetical protein